jgi:hypothetical protein
VTILGANIYFGDEQINIFRSTVLLENIFLEQTENVGGICYQIGSNFEPCNGSWFLSFFSDPFPVVYGSKGDE